MLRSILLLKGKRPALRCMTAGPVSAVVCLTASACWETHTYEPPIDDVAEHIVEIGALLDFTGSNSAASAIHLAAMECALEDARSELEPDGYDFRIRYSDTQSDPQAASVLMNTNLLNNVRITIGPYTSALVGAVESRIAQSQSLLISPSSTSLYLANRNDHIFRLAPNDSHMAEALVDLIWERGERALLLLYRDDLWGRSVADAVDREFTARGGDIISAYSYDPANSSDMADMLRQLQADIETTTGGGSSEELAIQLTSMSEGVSFFAMANDSFPELRNVNWYGSDGFVYDWSIFGNTPAAEFADEVDYTAPTYRVEVPDRYRHVVERIEYRTGVTPGAYTLLTYDAVRVAARTLACVVYGASYEELESTVRAVMAEHIGITGWLQMDAMGDRYGGEYDFFTVRSDGWDYWWERVDGTGLSAPGLPLHAHQ